MTKFPKMVYSYPASRADAVEANVYFSEIDGDGYLYFIAENDDELSEALKRGWFESFVDAKAKFKTKEIPSLVKKRGRPTKQKDKISKL